MSSTRGMTFRALQRLTLDGRLYVRFGADEETDPYRGDADAARALGLLAVRRDRLPRPVGLPLAHRTPGNAIRGD